MAGSSFCYGNQLIALKNFQVDALNQRLFQFSRIFNT